MNTEEQNFTDAQMLRKKAEEQLRRNQEKAGIPTMETDMKKLLHELQVHQVELEIQNEELRMANETLETALKKYTLLYDLAPMGYFTLDSDGRICDLNFTAAELLGDSRFALLDSNFKLFIAKESQDVFNNFFRNVFADKAKEYCEVKLGYNNKVFNSVYMEAIVIEDDDRRCLLSVFDISGFTNQKQL